MHPALLMLLVGGAEAGEFKRLGTHTAEASSWHTSDKGRFVGDHHPTFAVDDDRETAWVEGVEGDGAGQTLTIPVSRLRSARRLQLKIRNGNQRSEKSLENNPAPKTVVVRTLMGDRTQTREEITLERTKGWQVVEITVDDEKGFDAVSLEIRSVHPGRSGRAAITDVQVFVDSSVAHDPELEERRSQVREDRLKRLKDMGSYLGSIAESGPFAFEQYSTSSEELTPKRAAAALEAARENLARMVKIEDRYDVVVNRPITLPGGTWELEHVADLFQPETLTLAPTSREIAEREPPPEHEWYSEWVRSTYRIRFAKADDSRPVRMHFNLHTVVQERGTSESDTEYLVKFDDSGDVDWVFAKSDYDYDGFESGTRETLMKFSKDAMGRITGWELTSLTRSKNPNDRSETAHRETAVPAAGT